MQPNATKSKDRTISIVWLHSACARRKYFIGALFSVSGLSYYIVCLCVKSARKSTSIFQISWNGSAVLFPFVTNLLDGRIWNNLLILIVANYVGYMLNILSHAFFLSLLILWNVSFSPWFVLFCFHWIWFDTMFGASFAFSSFLSLIRFYFSHCMSMCVACVLNCWVYKSAYSV